MDARMQGVDGIHATKAIRRLLPGARVIGLSMFEEPEYKEAMLSAGASAYLCKSDPSGEIVRAIRALGQRSAAAPRVQASRSR